MKMSLPGSVASTALMFCILLVTSEQGFSGETGALRPASQGVRGHCS